MRWTRLLSSVWAVLVMFGGALAEERKYVDLISGTGAPGSFDINNDGVKALYVTFAGRSNVGPIHGGITVEYDFKALAPNSGCPAGMLKLPILVSAGTRAVTGTDGQLFLRDDGPGSLFCLNPITGAFTMSVKGMFIGGMGRFAGAAGTYQYKGSGNVLLSDDVGPFGGFVVETEGKLTLPNRPRDD